MEYSYIPEPFLDFARDTHICPRSGIACHLVYDADTEPRRDDIYLGAVGTNEDIDLLRAWLQKVSDVIPAKTSNQPNLFQAFIGFNKHSGFKSEFVLAGSNVKALLSKEINELMKIGRSIRRIEETAKMYGEKIRFLAQNKTPEVIMCIIPDKLYSVISTQKDEIEEQVEDHLGDLETNFRRLLKAEIMKYSNIPIQLIRENTLRGNPEGTGSTQDDATTAWNLCTALYYKSSNNKIPWKVSSATSKPLTCYVGISFYRSRDKTIVYSSLAQVFDEMGRNVILRGTPVNVRKNDRRPYLDSNQAYELLNSAINEYRIAMNTNPARLVIHKTSQFSDEEIDGFSSVAEGSRIDLVDMVSIGDSPVRLFRRGSYPPYRGSMIKLDDNRKILLYTRGSVPFFQTYPGRYIPQPIEIELFKVESSPTDVCTEILALTKMNWNNTQFDRKYPITLECARSVGKIIKYLAQSETAQANYRFYM
jgi:hypothetical protein